MSTDKKHPTIIAVDFDETLCANAWPDIGAPNEALIKHLKTRQAEEGVKLILWTCRVGEKLSAAVEWCVERGLLFDAVNENLPEMIEAFGSDTRKIFANEYIDDKSATYFNLPFGDMQDGSAISWAAREVEIACERENPYRKQGAFDYGCYCYESALKAYKSLLDDSHSGLSIQAAKQILNRLIDGKVLTPIEDTDDIWSDCVDQHDDVTSYQCRRMTSLFKNVYDDSRVTYKDIYNNIAVDIRDNTNTFHSGLVQRVVDEMFPVTMPYSPPDKPYKVFVEEFLSDANNGDFDTVAIHSITTPDGERISVDRYFKEVSALERWHEIPAYGYLRRKQLAEKLTAELDAIENTDDEPTYSHSHEI